MTLVMLLALVLGITVSGYVGVRVVGRRRTPQELRGDRWTAFERDFRAYASKVAASQKERRRRGDRGSSGR